MRPRGGIVQRNEIQGYGSFCSHPSSESTMGHDGTSPFWPNRTELCPLVWQRREQKRSVGHRPLRAIPGGSTCHLLACFGERSPLNPRND